MTREAIYTALFARLSSLPGFETISRRAVWFTKVTPAQQPALFVVQRGETVQRKTNQPPIIILSAELYVYANTAGDSSRTPATQINGLLDAVYAALAPDAGAENLTLGGLVAYARIGGAVHIDEGLLDDQGVVVVPIEMLANI